MGLFLTQVNEFLSYNGSSAVLMNGVNKINVHRQLAFALVVLNTECGYSLIDKKSQQNYYLKACGII